MKSLRLSLILMFVCAVQLQSVAQESLQEKYDAMLESTETYEQYKVIPRTTLRGFWSEVSDSLQRNTRTINDLQSQILTQQASIESLEGNVADLQTRLDESLNVNDSISFVGIQFSKLGYHLMVWLIIIVLATLGVISYLMFMRSNRVTTRVKKEYDTLNAEFEEHKGKAREVQAKLKRELQTAVNQLNERR
ncbi:hypothetical protein [Ekhidna sp. To15]|uniref:hypothetical protein n=1 Tax=Ekhidna sp. To15 TaxID=3395267 RepID=UPI003F5240C5